VVETTDPLPAGSRLCGAQPPTRGRNAAFEMAGLALYPPPDQHGEHTELVGRQSLSLCSKRMTCPSSELPLLDGVFTDTYIETPWQNIGCSRDACAGYGSLSQARHCLYQRTRCSA